MFIHNCFRGFQGYLRLFKVEFFSQSPHWMTVKNIENKGFFRVSERDGMGVVLKTPIRFQIANKINGFAHILPHF